jgi:dUTPase
MFFSVYQILATDSYTVNPGQTVRVSTNIVVMQSLGDPAVFFTNINQHPGYWLYKQCSAKFYMKEGVVSTHYTGIILVSVVNKSTDNVTIRQGTSLGCLHFNRFM